MNPEHYRGIIIEATERERSGVGINHFKPFVRGSTPEEVFADAEQRAQEILDKRGLEGRRGHFIEFTLPVREEYIGSENDK